MESIRIKALAAAAAFGVSALLATGASATDMRGNSMHAAMHKKHHRSHGHKHMAQRMSAAAAAPMRMAKAPRKSPGSCGTYMYWKAGTCVDARVTPPKKR